MARQVRCPRSVLLFAISLLLGNAILAAQAQQALPALPLDERVTGVLAPTPPPSVPSSSSAGTPQLEGSLADAVEQEVCENAQEGGHLLEKRQSSPPASSSTINIPQTAANGGLTMTQPPATAQATFYKIAQDNYITFGWNYTDVLVAPISLTLQAYCSQNGYTYPVGPTEGIPGDSTQFAWNPYEYENGQGATPLAEASYTLRVFRENGYNAAPSPGYMRSYAGTIFALYRPQPYVGLADGWRCAACSAALEATHIHPAVLATAAAFFLGTMTIWARLH